MVVLPPPTSIILAKGVDPNKTLNILELEGMYPDVALELPIFASTPSNPHPYTINFIRSHLGGAMGAGQLQPISLLSDELCASVDGLLVFRNYVSREDIARFKNLKVVVRCGVGYDRLDRVALEERGVIVCNVPDYGTNEIADHALSLALALRRGLMLHHNVQARPDAGPWAQVNTPEPNYMVARLQGATFGVLGLGRVGTAAAIRAKAFGWRVIFYDPYTPNGMDKALQITRVRTIEELFSQSSLLSIHCPHTTKTRKMVSHELLNLLPAGAVLVNTARGEIVDLDAVEAALKIGRLSAAGLDVLPVEPIPEPAHSLLQAYRNQEEWIKGRLMVTAHSAFYSPESLVDIRRLGSETMRNVLVDGGKQNQITIDTE